MKRAHIYLFMFLAVAGTVLILLNGCATTGTAPQPSTDNAWAPCTQTIRQANCAWLGSYPHVRQQHCETSCQTEGKSTYATKFIDACSDSRLEDVCLTTVQHPNCQFIVDRGGYIVTSDLGVLVGTDRRNRCNDSSLSTVVLDDQLRVITMYPGIP